MVKKLKLQGYSSDNTNYVLFGLKLRVKKKVKLLNNNENIIYKQLKQNQNQITTKVYYCSSKYLLTKYVNKYQQCFQKIHLNTFKNIITKISLLHQLNNQMITTFPYMELLNEIKINAFLQEIIHLYETENLVVSHNDLGLNNILVNDFENDSLLIDFEFTCLNLELFDYAHLALSFNLEEKYVNKIFTYKKLVTIKQQKKFYLVAYFICVIWKKYATDHIDKLKKYQNLYKHYKNLESLCYEKLVNLDKKIEK